MKLENRVAIITGATSGIGRASALLFAQEGARVVVTGRSEARGAAVKADIESRGGERARPASAAAPGGWPRRRLDPGERGVG